MRNEKKIFIHQHIPYHYSIVIKLNLGELVCLQKLKHFQRKTVTVKSHLLAGEGMKQ